MTLATSDTTRVSDDEFTWREWRLGEGRFASDGPMNFAVRPNVGYGGPGQHPVPKEWFARLEAFIIRRKKVVVKKTVALRERAVQIGLGEAKRGVRERGGNNRGPDVEKYQRADDLTSPDIGYAWCVSFVQWCYRQAGKPLFDRTASVGKLLGSARRIGMTVERPLRGDLGCLFINSDNWPDHIFIVVKVLKLGPVLYLHTVEGNTSSGESGSQDDGDGVWERKRFVRRSRVAFIRVPGTVQVEV